MGSGNAPTEIISKTTFAEYTKQVATFEPIKLEAHKFGTLITFSQEAIEDTGYNVEVS